MSDRGTDAELAREIGALIDALEDLQGELEPGNRERRRLPTPRDLLRFTSEVTIPAAILVLETNVRVLKLLQRTIRLSAGEPTGETTAGGASEAVRERAEKLGQRTLDQLDRTLRDLQGAATGRPQDDEAEALFEEAQRLQERIRADLEADQPVTDPDAPGLDVDPSDGSRSNRVNIDVESELESIRDQIDDEDSSDNGHDDGE